MITRLRKINYEYYLFSDDSTPFKVGDWVYDEVSGEIGKVTKLLEKDGYNLILDLEYRTYEGELYKAISDCLLKIMASTKPLKGLPFLSKNRIEEMIYKDEWDCDILTESDGKPAIDKQGFLIITSIT